MSWGCAEGPEVEIGGKKYLMFASNNYLGLANHGEIVKSAKDAAEIWLWALIRPFYFWNWNFA